MENQSFKSTVGQSAGKSIINEIEIKKGYRKVRDLIFEEKVLK